MSSFAGSCHACFIIVVCQGGDVIDASIKDGTSVPSDCLAKRIRIVRDWNVLGFDFSGLANLDGSRFGCLESSVSPSCSVAYGCAAGGAEGSAGLDASASGFGSRHCFGHDNSHVGFVSFGTSVPSGQDCDTDATPIGSEDVHATPVAKRRNVN